MFIFCLFFYLQVTSYTEANIAYEDFQPRELESANLIQMARLDVKVYPRVQSVYKVSFVSKAFQFYFCTNKFSNNSYELRSSLSVEFRELSHLTRDLCQAEKKINVVRS